MSFEGTLRWADPTLHGIILTHALNFICLLDEEVTVNLRQTTYWLRIRILYSTIEIVKAFFSIGTLSVFSRNLCSENSGAAGAYVRFIVPCVVDMSQSTIHM